MAEKKEVGMKEPKQYVSVSTRLPFSDAVLLNLVCNKNGNTPSNYIREIVLRELSTPSKRFLSGKNLIEYNRTNNSFSWIVESDSGEKKEVLKNLSIDFLKNLNQEISKAFQERNSWIHQTKPHSVDIPCELGEK